MDRITVSRRTLIRGAIVAAGVTTVGGAVLLSNGIASAYSWSRTLRQGTNGADVKELQIRVAGWAADGASQTPGRRSTATSAPAPPPRSGGSRPRTVSPSTASSGPTRRRSSTRWSQSDGSTAHFNWSEFTDRVSGTFNGGKLSAAAAKENARRCMYKLEALRVKLGNRPITVNSGFRSIAHNADVGGASDSMHLYGTAADLNVPGVSNRTVYQKAETCGFSGLETYTVDHQHVDSRADLGRAWWWENGTI